MINTREFELGDREFDYIRSLVEQRFGIVLNDAKRDMVYSRLSRRLRALGLKTFDAYCALLKSGDEKELKEFTNAVTTNLTYFFREPHHFELLEKIIIPDIVQRHGAKRRRLRIWSAGCSTGEEPYSLAISLREALPDFETWDAKILATDLDTDVLNNARKGIYEQSRVKGLSDQRLKRWFLRGRGLNQGKIRVSSDLRSMIHFGQVNLMEPWPMRGPFDVIFCRNVMIYFSKPTQRTLTSRFAQLLVNEGHLFVGHSESLFGVTNEFALVGQTLYAKRP